MVCQAASHTRFRALKHENGIAGKTTIIVRVIACFQPLQNCQNIRKYSICWTVRKHYSGCSFGLMVTAKDSQKCQQSSAWNSPDLNHMTHPQLGRNYNSPCLMPSSHTASLVFPRQPNSDLYGSNTEQPNAVAGIFELLPPYQNFPCPRNPCLENFHCALPHGLGVSDKPIDWTPWKRFLIFDRSQDQTRLFVSPSFYPQNHVMGSRIPAGADVLCEKVASLVDRREEKWDENHLNDGEGEMLDETEEIDALLYSDSDDDDDDDVISMRHTQFSVKDGYNNDKSLEGIMEEEVASSDGSPKRRKLLDGSYKKSSLATIEGLVKRSTTCNDEDDEESRSGEATTFYDGINSSKNEKTVKIQEALKFLGSIIPELKSKDPLSILEQAILYLETMKVEAQALGLSFPESASTAFH